MRTRERIAKMPDGELLALILKALEPMPIDAEPGLAVEEVRKRLRQLRLRELELHTMEVTP